MGLTLLALGIAAALVLLVLKVRSQDSVEVDPVDLERAKTSYQRSVALAQPKATVSRTSRVTPRPPPAAPEKQEPEPPVQRPRSDESTKRLMLANEMKRRGGDGREVRILPGTETFVIAMDEANQRYDRGDYEGAVEAAEALLKTQPSNVRMLRILVSANCILGNPDDATAAYGRLPGRDQRQMQKRCARYGIEFDEQ